MIDYLIYAFAIIGALAVGSVMCLYVDANIDARRRGTRDFAADALLHYVATNPSTETSLLILGDVSALTGVGGPIFAPNDAETLYTKLGQITEPSVTKMECLYSDHPTKSLYMVHFANVLDTIAFKLRYSNDLTFVEGGAV